MARPRVLLVPVDQALCFTRERGWHLVTAPPVWWIEERAQELVDDEERLRLHAPTRAQASRSKVCEG